MKLAANHLPVGQLPWGGASLTLWELLLVLTENMSIIWRLLTMSYILKNKDLKVTFSAKGGTMTSLQGADGTEYLWQGDARYWSGQAPVLFPICGSIRGNKAVVGGNKTTEMPRHGLVRKLDFQPEFYMADRVSFTISSDEVLLRQYPYPFLLHAEYRLAGRSLTVRYQVDNTGTEPMPFFVGGHPGFNCPLAPGEDYSDYELVFPQKETCTVPTPVTETGLIDMTHRTPLLNDSDTIPLEHALFHKDAVILDALQSRSITLRSKKSGRGVRVDFADFPYLILWSSANDGPFVALEPWTGLSTCDDEDDVLEHKRNVQWLEPGQSKSYQFTITVL